MLPKILLQDSNFNFYKRKINWTKKFVRDNIDIIETNYSKFPNRNKWNCNCHVIHDYEYDVQQIDYSFLRKEYQKVVEDFCRIKNYKLSHLSDIWYNYYKKNQYQEPHDHCPAGMRGYTAVHYMIFDRSKHSETKFTNPKIISPKINQSDILFFPCDYEHYVLGNKTDSPRLTTSFTFILQ
jgi:hypothetical protein